MHRIAANHEPGLNFEMLPPHFDGSSIPGFLSRCGGWESMMPAFNDYPSGYQLLVPRMFASLLYYHRKGVLEDLVSSAHPVFSSAAWSKLIAHGDELVFDQAWWLDHNRSDTIKVSDAARRRELHGAASLPRRGQKGPRRGLPRLVSPL